MTKWDGTRPGGDADGKGYRPGRDKPATLAGDLLNGADEIAEFLGWKKRRVYHMADRNKLPVFKVGASLCARRSSLLAWIAAEERAAVSQSMNRGG